MMNTPLLPGMQASHSSENVVRGRNQGCCGCGNNPMSPSRAEAGCAGVSNNVPFLQVPRVLEGIKMVQVLVV